MATTESEDNAIEDDYEQDVISVPDVETTCTICYAEFLDSEDLNIHVKQVHEGASSCPKICQFCEVTYKDLEDYALHIRDDHLLELKCCRSCTKCFTDHKKAKRHEKIHKTKTEFYACSQCTGLFATQVELETHEVVNHDNRDDGEVLRCMPHLSSLLKLKAVSLIQAEDKEFVCRCCTFTTTDLKSYIRHTDKNKCSVYVCDRCSNVFKAKKTLLRHLHCKNRCMYPKELMRDITTCTMCNNEVHAKQMRLHLKYCKTYTCKACNVRFDSIVELSAHQSEAHPLELDIIKCKYCPREYVGQEALEKHIERSHRPKFGLYKYACKSCDAIFKHPQTLFAHYFTKHKELEPYTCKICNKKFRIRKRFTIHIKLEHKGAGVVEFNDQYHVFFSEEKSENPFIPTCVIPEYDPNHVKTAKKGPVGDKKKTVVRDLKRKHKDVSETGVLALSAMETEDEPEENADYTIEECSTSEPKRKKRKRRVVKNSAMSSSEDEAEPLLIIKKRAERKQFQKRYLPDRKTMREQMLKRKQFTCNICKKYCYTYQNYNNHLKIHSKNESIECVKCSRSFRTKNELTEHITTDHATSKLIETLKSVLERKNVETQNNNCDDISSIEDLEPSKRFLRTIKKCRIEKLSPPARITLASSDQSVRNFIENFVPDTADTVTKELKSDPCVTIKRYDSPFYRKHTIKMTRFIPEPPIQNFKLKMPEKYKEQEGEKVKLKIRIVQQPMQQSMFESYENVNYDNTEQSQDYDNYDDYKNDEIPEVAQEVMLEESEENPKQTVQIQAPHKIVIPKLPKGYSKIHIATLSHEAPYYKIIKVEGTTNKTIVIETDKKEKKEEKPGRVKHDVISLPDGTKFVTANPLAHLLGDKPVEEVLELTKNKHYKPIQTDFKGLLVEALQNLDKPQARKTKKKLEKIVKPKRKITKNNQNSN